MISFVFFKQQSFSNPLGGFGHKLFVDHPNSRLVVSLFVDAHYIEVARVMFPIVGNEKDVIGGIIGTLLRSRLSTTPMPSKQPQLGSLAVQAPSPTPQIVHVSPSTCHNLSLFKDILNEYRRLDDTIVMRLNRANAGVRDRDRLRTSTSTGTVQDQACGQLWRELVENWKRRTQLVEYCVNVVDQSIAEKQRVIEDGQDAAAQRKTQALIYSEGVKRKQVHNELTVERIVRQRSMEAFRARCQYFTPPQTDVEGHRMWEK